MDMSHFADKASIDTHFWNKNIS